MRKNLIAMFADDDDDIVYVDADADDDDVKIKGPLVKKPKPRK